MAAMNTGGATRSVRILEALKKRWWVVVVAVVVGGVGAFAASAAVTPLYHSSASLFFSVRDGGTATDINQGSTYTQSQITSFAELATSAKVFDRVVDDLDGAVTATELRRNVTATSAPRTVILDINVKAPNRDLSARIANSAADNLIYVVAQVSPAGSDGNSTVSATVIEPAVPATFQASPNKKQNALLGAFLGLALAILGFFLVIVFDTRVRSVAALKSMTDRPLLGIAERTRKTPDARPVALRSPLASAAERFRQIRAGLRFAAASHKMKVIAVTSSLPGEGKTMTALNLALVTAESKERVLLIDADLRRPRVADYLGLEGAVGLTTVLVGGVMVDQAIQRFGETTLDILAAGEVPPNPAELCASKPMRTLIQDMKSRYDVVLVDTAPLLSVADAAVLASLVDSTVVVIDASRLHRAQLEQALEALDVSGAHVAGLILNRVKRSSRRDSYYREYHQEPVRAPRTLWNRYNPVSPGRATHARARQTE